MTPKIPTFNVTAINALRDRLMERVFVPRIHESPQGEQFNYLVNDLCATLPEGIPRDAIFETARQVLDVELTPAVCLRLAWRIAGNLPTLKAGLPILPWTSQVNDEWVPAQIVKVSPAVKMRNNRAERGHEMFIRVQAGTPCCQVTSRFLTRRFSFALARRLGFTKRTGRFPYTDPMQLVNLRFIGEILAEKSATKIWLGRIHMTTSIIDSNRELLRLRLHLDPCPNGWTHPCHNCVVGYLTCPAGTHREDFQMAFCRHCGLDAFFDPETSTEICVACARRTPAKQ